MVMDYLTMKRFLVSYLRIVDAAYLFGISWINSSDHMNAALSSNSNGIHILVPCNASYDSSDISIIQKFRLLQKIKKSSSLSKNNNKFSVFSFFAMEKRLIKPFLSHIIRVPSESNFESELALIILHPKRQRYGFWKEINEWTESSISILLEDLIYGQYSLMPFESKERSEL